MKILSVGQFSAHGLSNTCLHRNWALKKFGEVDEVDSTLTNRLLLHCIVNYMFQKCHLPIHFSSTSLNRDIRKRINDSVYDIVWIDKGIFVSAKTLKYIKQRSPRTIIVGYSPDNMAERHNQSQHFLEALPLYDYYITTKSYIVDYLKNKGVPNVIFVNNAYEEAFHHPYILSEEERERLGGVVGFIGSWEEERFRSIKYLAEHGIPVRVWGGGKWLEYKDKIQNLTIEDRGLFSEEYNKALSAFDISLCFLRKMNADLQTTRTMEIPACQSLLMAERTPEHEMLFEEGKEAMFFSSNEELLKKTEYLIQHPDKCREIARAGRERCLKSGYSNRETIRSVLSRIANENTIHI